MDSIQIRAAVLEDIDTLLIFEQGVIQAERPFDCTLKPNPTHYYNIQQMISSAHVHLVVAVLNGNLIGSGYARIESSKFYLQHEKHSYLGFMYVLPEHRGKAVNSLIIDALKTWTLAQGITEMRLNVYMDNDSAIKAYEKVGFEKHMVEMRLGLT